MRFNHELQRRRSLGDDCVRPMILVLANVELSKSLLVGRVREVDRVQIFPINFHFVR